MIGLIYGDYGEAYQEGYGRAQMAFYDGYPLDANECARVLGFSLMVNGREELFPAFRAGWLAAAGRAVDGVVPDLRFRDIPEEWDR